MHSVVWEEQVGHPWDTAFLENICERHQTEAQGPGTMRRGLTPGPGTEKLQILDQEYRSKDLRIVGGMFSVQWHLHNDNNSNKFHLLAGCVSFWFFFCVFSILLLLPPLFSPLLHPSQNISDCVDSPRVSMLCGCDPLELSGKEQHCLKE